MPKHTSLHRILTGLLFLGLIPDGTRAADIAPDWTSIPGFQGPAASGVVTADLDGDGVRETIVTGTSRLESPGADDRWFLAVIGLRPDVGFRAQQLRRLEAGEYFLGRIDVAHVPGGEPRIVAVIGNGAGARLVQFGGPRLSLIAEVPVPYDFQLNDVADVDADGDLEVVGCLCADTVSGPAQIRDLSTGSVAWTGTSPGARTRVGQLDADAALELVVGGFAGSAGHIVDGASHLTQWTFDAGFNGKIVVGDFRAETPGNEFAVVGNSGGSGTQGFTRMFRSEPDFAATGTLPITNPGGLSVIDTTGDGIDELVFGSGIGQGLANGVHVLSLDTGTGLQWFPQSALTVSGLTVAPLTPGPAPYLVHGGGVDSSGRDVLRIVHMASSITYFHQFDERGPHSSVVVGDVRAANAPEVIRVSHHSESGSAGPVVQSIDTGNGLERRIATSAMIPHGNDQGVSILLAQIDTDPQLEIILGSQDENAPKVEALDGISFEREWVSPSLRADPSVAVEALVFVPSNDGGRIYAATNGTLVALSAASGQPVAAPVSLPSDGPNTLVAANQDADAALELSFGTGSTVHVLDTGTLEVEGYMTADPPIIGQHIEQVGNACVNVLVFADRLERRECLVGTLLSVRPLAVPAATWVGFVTDSFGDLALSDGHRVLLDHQGQVVEQSEQLGHAVGWRNRGHVRVENGVVHVVIGGQDSVHQIRFAGHLFADSFE